MAYEEINALGYVEVTGLAAAIETADSMLKCAEVRLLRQLLRDPAQITLTVEGGLGACRAAVDAGRETATRLGAFVAASVMGRPSDDTAAFVLRLAEAGRAPFGPAPAAAVPTAAPAPSAPMLREGISKLEAATAAPMATVDIAPAVSDVALLEAVDKLPGGGGAAALAWRVQGDAADVKAIERQLDALCQSGQLVKVRGRYRRATGAAESNKPAKHSRPGRKVKPAKDGGEGDKA